MGPPQHILVQSVPLTYVDTSGVNLGQAGVTGASSQALFMPNSPGNNDVWIDTIFLK